MDQPERGLLTSSQPLLFCMTISPEKQWVQKQKSSEFFLGFLIIFFQNLVFDNILSKIVS